MPLMLKNRNLMTAIGKQFSCHMTGALNNQCRRRIPVKGGWNARWAICREELAGIAKLLLFPKAYENKKVVIQFDGVYHQSDVYINGQHLGFHPYGYTTFEYDMTPYLNYGGENVISVRVDHSNSPSSRWYSGSGIYRHVWIKASNPIHVATWGTFITTPEISEKEAQVNVATTIKNDSQESIEVLVQNQIPEALPG